MGGQGRGAGQVIPDEAVEAAALGIHTRGGVSVPEAREYARAALDFAAPHLMAAAFDDGYREACEDIIGLKPSAAPMPHKGRVPTKAEQAEIDAFQNGVYGAEPPEWWLNK